MLKSLPVTYNAPADAELPLMNFIPFRVMLLADTVSILDNPFASSVAYLVSVKLDPPTIVNCLVIVSSVPNPMYVFPSKKIVSPGFAEFILF